ncbi:MAG: hypothetical protein HC814_02965 [Rhodobacteraceae bacterium]|nr:hypothetical protein [Paracoccaceae bacterium]
MFFELIGTIIAGAAAALLVWAINRALKGRLPNWLVPAAAGAAMLLATISSEYSWYTRTAATLPAGMEIAQTVEEKAFYRPWTYARPYVSRFVAVDYAGARSHPDIEGQRIVDLLFYGRWARMAQVPVLFDCVAGRSADIVDGIEFGENGSITNANWRVLAGDDPILKAACRET